MERNWNAKEIKGKNEYTIKSSATLKFNEYLDKSFPGLDNEGGEQILKEVSNIMFLDLLNTARESQVYYDSVGIWLTIGDTVLENSISLSVLDGIKEYSTGDVVPIYEFIKMTLPNEGEIS